MSRALPSGPLRNLAILLVGLLAVLAVSAGVLVPWGLIEPYFLDRREEVAIVPNLPAQWEGQRFALVADWQVGMWLGNDSTVREAVEELTERRPAFVLVAGDFVYHARQAEDWQSATVVDLIRPLVDTEIPVFAVLGNHDYGMKVPGSPVDEELARRVTSALGEVGVRVLHNEAVALPAPGSPSIAAGPAWALHLVGIGPTWPGRADGPAALAGVPEGAPRLVVMHNPDAFVDLPAGSAPLAVAAHTHGGQVRVPGLPQWSWMSFVKEDEVHADGWIVGEYGRGDNRLYVNRGIGFSLLPLRINAPPELTLFTLRSP